MRQPRPFYRKQTDSYYVKLDGKFVPLGKDKVAAWEQYHDLMAKRSRGELPAENSVAYVLERYWEWLQRNRAPETANRRKPWLKSFRLWVGKLSVRQLKPHHVDAWIAASYPDASDTYRHTLITTIKTALAWADEMGLCGNPIAKMRKPQPAVRQDFVPYAQWPKLIQAATDQPMRDWLQFMLSTGIRAQEMFKAEAQHLDRPNRRLVFPIRESKGKKRSRVIWLPDEALEIVDRLAKQYPEGKLFRNRFGKPWTRNAIRCRFRRLKDVMGMPWLTSTTLRHSFAHHRLTSGQDSHVVSRLLGHVDGRMLETRYGHVDQNAGFMIEQANRGGAVVNPEDPKAASADAQRGSHDSDSGQGLLA